MQPPLRERLTPEIVDQLKARKLSNADAAAQLGVNATYLSTVFNRLHRRNKGEISQQREAAAALVEGRRQIRIREAKKVLNGTKSLPKAAATAKCSERTMRRYVQRIAPPIPGEAYE